MEHVSKRKWSTGSSTSKSEEYREGEEPMGFDQAEFVEGRDQKHS